MPVFRIAGSAAIRNREIRPVSPRLQICFGTRRSGAGLPKLRNRRFRSSVEGPNPDTSPAECTGHRNDGLGPNGSSSGPSTRVSRWKCPKSWPTGQPRRRRAQPPVNYAPRVFSWFVAWRSSRRGNPLGGRIAKFSTWRKALLLVCQNAKGY